MIALRGLGLDQSSPCAGGTCPAPTSPSPCELTGTCRIPDVAPPAGSPGPAGPQGSAGAPSSQPSFLDRLFGSSSVDIGKAFQSSYASARGTLTPRALTVGSGTPFSSVSVPASRQSPRFQVPKLAQPSINWGSSYRDGSGVGGGRAALYLALAVAAGLVWWKKPWKKAAEFGQSQA